MSESGPPKKRFPLTLDFVTGIAGRKKAATPHRLNSTQTATQNAAKAAGQTSTQSGARSPTGTRGSQPAGTVTGTVSSVARTAAPRMQPVTAMATDRHANVPLVSDAVRKAMVQRLAEQGVRDPMVLAAMEAVPRHLFLEPGLASQAYIDASLPIGYHQTISQPYIVARMIEILREGTSGKLKKVLEIGTGCGYQAAVLAQVADEVYSIERIRPLHEQARNNLRPLRIPNLRLHYGDGMLGLPQAGPFDGIILAAAGLEIPQALMEQLAIGGRMIAPIGNNEQVLKLVVRTGRNEWLADTLERCHFVPLRPGTFG